MSPELIHPSASNHRRLDDHDGIAIQKARFAFYEQFLKRAHIKDGDYIQFWIDYEKKLIAFKVSGAKSADSYKIANPGNPKVPHRHVGATQVLRIALKELGFKRLVLYKPKQQTVMDVPMWVISPTDPDNRYHKPLGKANRKHQFASSTRKLLKELPVGSTVYLFVSSLGTDTKVSVAKATVMADRKMQEVIHPEFYAVPPEPEEIVLIDYGNYGDYQPADLVFERRADGSWRVETLSEVDIPSEGSSEELEDIEREES
jgi:hypothetical protein